VRYREHQWIDGPAVPVNRIEQNAGWTASRWFHWGLVLFRAQPDSKTGAPALDFMKALRLVPMNVHS
jgi:hypothetical protein